MTTPDALALSVADAVRASGLSRSTLYVEMASGRLPHKKAGTRRLILRSDLEAYLRALPSGSTAA